MAITMFLMALSGALPSSSGATVVTQLSAAPRPVSRTSDALVSSVSSEQDTKDYHHTTTMCESIWNIPNDIAGYVSEVFTQQN